MNEEDAKKLACLWTQSQPTVVSYIYSVLTNFHQAEDVLQAVAAALVKQFAKFDQTRPFLPWAMGIAKIEVLRARKAAHTDRHLFDESLVDYLQVAYEEEGEQLTVVRQALYQCLKKQRGRSVEALRWRYAHDLKPAQVADRMGVTSGAVRALLHRSRTLLRECISRKVTEAAI